MSARQVAVTCRARTRDASRVTTLRSRVYSHRVCSSPWDCWPCYGFPFPWISVGMETSLSLVSWTRNASRQEGAGSVKEDSNTQNGARANSNLATISVAGRRRVASPNILVQRFWLRTRIQRFWCVSIACSEKMCFLEIFWLLSVLPDCPVFEESQGVFGAFWGCAGTPFTDYLTPLCDYRFSSRRAPPPPFRVGISGAQQVPEIPENAH